MGLIVSEPQMGLIGLEQPARLSTSRLVVSEKKNIQARRLSPDIQRRRRRRCARSSERICSTTAPGASVRMARGWWGGAPSDVQMPTGRPTPPPQAPNGYRMATRVPSDGGWPANGGGHRKPGGERDRAKTISIHAHEGLSVKTQGRNEKNQITSPMVRIAISNRDLKQGLK